jgi:hypothetical protein
LQPPPLYAGYATPEKEPHPSETFFQWSSLMVVDFKGSAPHDLGLVQLATVQLVDGNAEMTLHILDDWHRPANQIVRVQMAPAVARELSERLATIARSAASP